MSFYFPPAGGGGVQRPLKLAQYLPAMGIETHVLARTIHGGSTATRLRMPSQAWVHRARYVGVSGGKPSEVLVGTQGLERAMTRARLQLRRLVVPDENATWAITAIPAGIRLVREHGIDVVVSTSARVDTPDRCGDRPRDRRPLGRRPPRLTRLPRASAGRYDGDEGESLLHQRVARLVASRATRSRASPRRSARRRAASSPAVPW